MNTTTGELKIATQDNQKFQDATALATKELVVGSVQYLGTVGTTTELNAKTPNSAGDFCRVSATDFTLPKNSSITGAAVTTHAGDLLLCESISPSVKWSVIHGELDKNAGTITGIKMNGSSKGTSGVVDLGTVLTAHQAIKINGTAITPGTLNLKAGNNVTFNNSNGTLTINASGGSGSDDPV